MEPLQRTDSNSRDEYKSYPYDYIQKRIPDFPKDPSVTWLPDAVHQAEKFLGEDLDSFIDSTSDENSATDWNEQFQRALELPEDSGQQIETKYRILSRLSTDFIKLASDYGRTIITELVLPPEMRTIQTHDMGGFAGGKKLIVNGIVFKLSRDVPSGDAYIYGGVEGRQDELASKGAGHDLRGAVHVFAAVQQLMKPRSDEDDNDDKAAPENIDHLRLGEDERVSVPIQAIIDYRGFRLLGMPLLQLGGSKPVYGSHDAGRTVHADDESINSILSRIGQFLHLKSHRVRDKELYFAADVEGHVGADGRRYLLDLARAFPPEDCLLTPHLPFSNTNVHMYRRLRPELLSSFRRSGKCPPLSSDAFSAFGAHNRDEHNAEVSKATRMLVKDLIPEFARWLVQECDKSVNRRNQLRDTMAEECHKRGINLRHLGLVARCVREIGGNVSTLQMVVAVMVSRTLKNMLRSWMRREIHRAKPSEFLMNELVRGFLNLISHCHPKSRAFWDDVQSGMYRRFGRCSFTTEDVVPASPLSNPGLVRSHSASSIHTSGGSNTSTPSSKKGKGTKSSKRKKKHKHGHRGSSNTSLGSQLQSLKQQQHMAFEPCAVDAASRSALNTFVREELFFIVQYVLTMVGKRLSSKCIMDCRNSVDQFQFTLSDVKDGSVRVKTIPFLSYCMGKMLLSQAYRHCCQALIPDMVPATADDVEDPADEGAGEAKGDEGEPPADVRAWAFSEITHCGDLHVATRLFSLSVDRFSEALQTEPTNSLVKDAVMEAHVSKHVIESIINDHDFSKSCLMKACQMKKASLVRVFLKAASAICTTECSRLEQPGLRDYEVMAAHFVNFRSRTGETALFYAVKARSQACIRLLLQHGADANIACHSELNGISGLTPFSLAVYEDEVDIVTALLTHTQKTPEQTLNIDTRTGDGRTPLIIAARRGNLEVTKLLLEYQANVCAVDASNRSAVDWANKRGNDEIARLLSVARQEEMNLFSCIKGNDQHGLTSLLQRGCRVNCEDERGRSVLSWACELGNPTIVKLLLDARAVYQANAQDKSQKNPLTLAIARSSPFYKTQTGPVAGTGYTETVKLLLEARVSCNEPEGVDGMPPIVRAAKQKAPEVVRLLLESSANPLATDTVGCTCMAWAAYEGDMSSLHAIAEHFSRTKQQALYTRLLNWQTHQGWTALLKAVSNHQPEATAFLIEQKCNLEAQNKKGRTALHYAVINGYDDLILPLLNAKASLKTADKTGRTPVDHASESKHSATTDLLRKHTSE